MSSLELQAVLHRVAETLQ